MDLRRLILGLALAALAGAGAAPAFARDEHGRLDPEERMRLRGAIQRHAWEDRVRAREAWRAGRGDAPVAIAPGQRPVPGYAPAPGYGAPPGYAPTPGYAPVPGATPYAVPGYGAGMPPPYGVSGGPDGQAYGYGFGPRPGLPRLSPEERDALRQQLRDARRHAVDQPGPGR